MAASKDLTIEQGKTFTQVLRWEIQPVVYKAITAITQSAPVRITCPEHGVPQGWRVAVVSVKGMAQINSSNTPPKAKDYHQATVINADTLELNDINAAEFKAYVSGGYVQYNTPVDLTGMSARLVIKDKVGGTELLRLDSSALGGIVLNNSTKTITATISATVSAALTWKKGVYELEIEDSLGHVSSLLAGAVTVTKEIAS